MRLLLGASLLACNLFGGGGRVAWVTETITEHVWLINGPDGRELCRLVTEDDNLPSVQIVTAICGQWTGDQYRGGQAYAHHLTAQQSTRQVAQPLPPLEINLAISESGIRLTAYDPLPGEEILQIDARLGDHPVVCAASPCDIPLPSRDTTIQYWAASSYGDESRRHVALIAITDDGVDVYGDRTVRGWHPRQRVPHLWRLTPPHPLPRWLEQASQASLYTETSVILSRRSNDTQRRARHSGL